MRNMEFGANLNPKNIGGKKSRKKLKGRNIDTVVMRAVPVIATLATIAVGTTTMMMLKGRKIIVEKSIQEDIDRGNVEERITKPKIEVTTTTPQTPPQTMIAASVTENAGGGDLLGMKIIEVIERQEATKRRDERVTREGEIDNHTITG